jgi:hypothetical protein
MSDEEDNGGQKLKRNSLHTNSCASERKASGLHSCRIYVMINETASEEAWIDPNIQYLDKLLKKSAQWRATSF